MDTGRNDPTKGTLVSRLGSLLRARIVAGDFPPGARLPSEAQLSAEHGVSRPTVREAIAALRSDGLVEARRGSGVYVLDVPPDEAGLFAGIDPDRISTVIEMLEFRTAVETEAAALAAIRRSPAQIERLVETCHGVADAARAGSPTSDADLAFHHAIAEATNNPKFANFLGMLGKNAIPRHALRPDRRSPLPKSYVARLEAEHDCILQAILDQDADAARAAMRKHLEGSQSRYRAMMRRPSAAV